MTRLGVVTGLEAEARLLRARADPRNLLVAAAPGAAAGDATTRLIGAGATALLSFGLAGGLDPHLAPGRLIVAEAIAGPRRTGPADAAWRRRAVAAIGGETAVGRIAGRDAPCATSADKATLFAATGALAVDTESHAVAEVAEAHGLPFLAIRAVADPAWRALPKCALTAIRADGSLHVGALLRELAGRPADLGSLWLLARDYRAAMAALRRAAAKAAPGFGLG